MQRAVRVWGGGDLNNRRHACQETFKGKIKRTLRPQILIMSPTTGHKTQKLLKYRCPYVVCLKMTFTIL